MSQSMCLAHWIHYQVSRNPELLRFVLLFFIYLDRKTIPSMEMKDLCLSSTEFKTSLFINYDTSVQDHEGYLISIKARHFLSPRLLN